MPSEVCVLVVVDSPLGLLPLGDTSVAATAIERARSARCAPDVQIWLHPDVRAAWTTLKSARKPECFVNSAPTLREAAMQVAADIVLIHEAQRPLTLPSTFDRVAEAVIEHQRTARPAHVVVDTLKTVNAAGELTGTINRDVVQSLTSPEGYVRNQILNLDPPAGWHVASSTQSDFVAVRGDQESLKVREPEDVLLVESFLAWQTL